MMENATQCNRDKPEQAGFYTVKDRPVSAALRKADPETHRAWRTIRICFGPAWQPALPSITELR